MICRAESASASGTVRLRACVQLKHVFRALYTPEHLVDERLITSLVRLHKRAGRVWG